uniref:Uncharacterized protein n=1 Tax=Glossina austeni TaxID=7395 RepID=A0A1A9V7S2_GLOAU
MPREAPRETHKEFQPVARRCDLPNNRAWTLDLIPQERRINTAAAHRRRGQSGQHQYICPNSQVLPTLLDLRSTTYTTHYLLATWRLSGSRLLAGDPNGPRGEPASRTVASTNLANTPCPQRVMLPDRYTAIRRPISTQPSQQNPQKQDLRFANAMPFFHTEKRNLTNPNTQRYEAESSKPPKYTPAKQQSSQG